MRDPYSILGVSKDATDDEVKRAYHDLARKYHPDNYDDDNPLKDLAEEKMQEINSAYDEITRMRANPQGSSSGNTYTGSTSGVYYEIRKLIGKLKEQGYSLVPIRIYLSGQRIKVELGLAKGKKSYDKRQSIAEASAKREIERKLKERFA